jgi:hypothetical protein
MLLRIDADASFHSEPEARSRAGGHFTLGRASDPDFVNGPVECVAKTIPTVVASSAEAEYAAIFLMGQIGVGIRNTLSDIGYTQPPTIITTDNSVAKGIATMSCKQKRSKAVDLRYHWIRDKVSQGVFDVVWHSGASSIADFLTKPLPTANFLKMRKYYVVPFEPTFTSSRSRRTASYNGLLAA